MEHIPLPSGCAEPWNSDHVVPNYCGSNITLGAYPELKVEFMEYEPYNGICLNHPALSPSFKHFSRRDSKDILEFELQHFLGARKEGELMGFLQSWLFWGLLDLIFQAQLRTSDYLADYKGVPNARITTHKLVQQLEQWQTRAYQPADTPLEQKNWWQLEGWWHVEGYLYQISKVIEAIQASKHIQHVDNAVLFSIASVAEYVAAAGEHIMGRRDENRIRCRYEERLSSIMVLRGWCPSETSAVNNQLTSCASKFYLSMISKSPEATDDRLGQLSGQMGSEMRHKDCSLAACTRWKVDPAVYKTKHRTECNGCSQVEVDESTISRILQESDGFPIVRLERTGELQIVVEPLTSETPYIAISHVWADGLGNKGANALPICQMKHLSDLILNLENAQIYDSRWRQFADHRIWMDTLCVPVHDREAKKIALNRMRRVYEDAEYVLILDSTLESFNSQHSTLLECTFRLMVSPWNSRVWTLQEGTLPKRPLAQFKDRAIDLRCMHEYCENTRRDDLRHRSIAWDLIEYCERNRRPFHSGDLRKYPANITSLMHSMCHRRVDRPEDEALCVAFMLDVDVSSIIDKPTPRERMAELWRAISHSHHQRIPSSIIFNNTRRLSPPGLQWAPTTFLLETNRRPDLPDDSIIGDVYAGTLTAAGLAIPALGVRLASFLPSASPSLPNNMILTSSDSASGKDVESIFYHQLDREGQRSRSWQRFFRFVEEDAFGSMALDQVLQDNPIDKLVILYESIYARNRRLGDPSFGDRGVALIGRIINGEKGARQGDGGDLPLVETLALGWTTPATEDMARMKDDARVGTFESAEEYTPRMIGTASLVIQ